jgi:hypothetical protein
MLAVLVWWLKRKRAPPVSAQNHSKWDKQELDGAGREQPSIMSQRPPEELPYFNQHFYSVGNNKFHCIIALFLCVSLEFLCTLQNFNS